MTEEQFNEAAADLLALDADAPARLRAEHRADRNGRCRSCLWRGVHAVMWPCGPRRLADRAQAIRNGRVPRLHRSGPDDSMRAAA